jgi:hypothetical protein
MKRSVFAKQNAQKPKICQGSKTAEPKKVKAEDG